MTINDLQEAVASELAACAFFRAHGIPVVRENRPDAEAEAERALAESGGICAAVVTPELNSLGTDENGVVMAEASALEVAVGETAANRIGEGRATALDAAIAAARALTARWPDLVTFSGIRQTAEGEMTVATASFGTSIRLSLQGD